MTGASVAVMMEPEPLATFPHGTILECKVPHVTIYFWMIKILATTVGETFADFLDGDLNFGLTGTTGFMFGVLAVLLVIQFTLRKYVPVVYWLVVVAISTAGTLFTDNLTDNLNMSLFISTILFFVLLMATFGVWYHVERTLSIHSIYTRRREAFYWLAILFTFALGTAVGDLIAEQLNIGYGNSLLLFAGCIILASALWYFKVFNPVVAFWIVYILTRPLGASLGDLMSQNPADSEDSGGSGSGSGSAIGGSSSSSSSSSAENLPSAWKAGLNLGTTITSIIFLSLIAILVIFLTITKKDRLPTAGESDDAPVKGDDEPRDSYLRA